ncbi:MAG: sugar phosphate nucleotidyltransferase [Thermodesulfovibrionia bacterium]|nr:sugar phosphate nucleotidyltransferase [Thermodesulfovibrionia bacterium]
MKAVILAGGKGTRLAPYTTVFPKPLLPIGDTPILEIILRQLKHYGFSEAILACGYLAELIQAYFMNNQLSKELTIRYHRENKPLGTAGALATIEGLDSSFLVMNGDILTSLDYSKLIQYHKEKDAALTIAIAKKSVKIDLGVLHLDNGNRIIGYDEKPVKEFPVSTGIYVYGPRALDFIEPNTYLDLPTLVLRLIEAKELVIGFPSDAFWLDMGNKDDYEKAVQEFEQNKSSFLPSK